MFLIGYEAHTKHYLIILLLIEESVEMTFSTANVFRLNFIVTFVN